MKKSIIEKGLVFGIIILFVGISVVSSIGSLEESCRATIDSSILYIGGSGPGNQRIIQNTIDYASYADDFDEKIETLMLWGHMPSLVACIVKNNTVVWSKGYGFYDYYKKKNATVNIVYPVASISKSITATAIMQLNETGLIGLDDNVSEYLPFDLKNPKYPGVNITFRMLLAHQSSLADTIVRFTIYFSFLRVPYDQLGDYLLPDGVFYQPRVWNDYPPGENVTYSTVGFEILGYLVEQITQQPFLNYCQEQIFEPLQMKNTSFFFSNFNKNKLACLYFWVAGLYFKLPRIQTRGYAGGGLKTTISDLSHFLIMHTNRGVYDGVRILTEESVEEMHRVQYPGYYDEDYLHGLGWYLKNFSDGEIYGGHGGNHQGARAVMRMRYSDRVGVTYFWNQNSFFLMHLKLTREEEKEAIIEIEKALFEKACSRFQ
ncbi:MAG: serine hydrolase [Thermoplasmatales archaeon]|nr:MAG: serine hydrolase [Thermoplasmatales archaeon]